MSIEPKRDGELARQEIPRPLGIEEYDRAAAEQGRIVMPLLKVIQTMSDDFVKERIEPGVFRNTLSGEVIGNELEIIPVGIRHYRRLFVDRQVACSSNDALTGYGDPGGSCLKCPLSKWEVIDVTGQRYVIERGIANYRTKKGEELIQPKCQEQWVFLCIVLNSQWKIPGALIFSKTSYNKGMNFGFLLKAAPPDTVYKVTTEQVTGSKGTWFTPNVTLLRRANEAETKLLTQLRTDLESAQVEVQGEDDTPQ